MKGTDGTYKNFDTLFSNITLFDDDIINVVEVEGLTRIDEEEFIELVYPDTGSGLDIRELREGIKRAFRKKIFQDIIVQSEPAMGGMALKYIVKEVPLVNKITIEGNRNVSARKIKKIFPFKQGEDYREGAIGKAESEIREFYRRKGYPSAEIVITVKEILDEPGVDMSVSIEEGAPVIVEAVDIPLDARRFVPLSIGDVYNQDKMDEGVNKLREYYKKKKYINPVVGPYSLKEGRLIVPLSPGKRLEVIFENNSVISTRKLRKEVVFLEHDEVSDELSAEIAESIKRLYVSRGYYYAEVAAMVESEDDVIRVTFIIFEGKQVLLRKIKYMGISINPDAVKKINLLSDNEPYNDNLLTGSNDVLIRFYNALGYLNTEITEVRKTFLYDGTVLDLEFQINEGLQTVIDKIVIFGSERFTGKTILKTIKIEQGAPYNVIDIGDARYRVLSLYSQNGFMDALVDVESSIENQKAVLTFRITENKPTVIGRVILQGNNKTKAEIVKREFTLGRGD